MGGCHNKAAANSATSAKLAKKRTNEAVWATTRIYEGFLRVPSLNLTLSDYDCEKVKAQRKSVMYGKYDKKQFYGRYTKSIQLNLLTLIQFFVF
jgi:hypothetical protein